MIKRNKFIIFLMIVISVSSMAGIFGEKGVSSIKKWLRYWKLCKNTIRNEFRNDNNTIKGNWVIAN